MKKFVNLVAAVAVCGFASSAFAADMPMKTARPASVMAYDWSGFYLGGNAGWQSSTIGLSNPDFGTISYSPRHNSFAIGGFAGAQRQFGQIVLGIEGGYMAAFNDASLGTTPSISIFIPVGASTGQAKLKDIWSVGGRLGWAMGQWMPYATGGYASGNFQFNAQDPGVGGLTEQANSSNSGGYLGGGIDWAFTPNWIFGAEYRHYWFSTKTVVSSISNGTTENVNFAPSTDTVMGRVSYKFGWPR